MKNYKNQIWLVTKIVTAIFQIPATWSIFARIFRDAGRSEFLVYITTFLSIILIDLFFLAVLAFLEDQESDPVDKIPMVVVSLFLLAAIIYIGFLDEGILAAAPRLALVGLVMTDDFIWCVSLIRWLQDRDRIEVRERNKRATKRVQVVNQEFVEALEEARPAIRARELYRLGQELKLEEIFGIKILTEQQSEQLKQVDMLALPKPKEVVVEGHPELGENIFRLEDNTLGWTCPKCNQTFLETSLGQPYKSEFGIRRAMSRHLCKSNGHLEPAIVDKSSENGW